MTKNELKIARIFISILLLLGFVFIGIYLFTEYIEFLIVAVFMYTLYIDGKLALYINNREKENE